MAKRRVKLPIGEALRQARLKAGLSQEALALDADVDRTYLSHLENNQRSPTVEMLATLCRPLGVATSELIRQAEKGR